MASKRMLNDPLESFHQTSSDVPNPFERRQFAFQVLPDEKDPMSRARKHSFIMPTLKTRLQQLLTTRVWEYMMFVLSMWSFIPLLIGDRVLELRTFFELTHEINQAALCIEVFCKLYADWRWFFYDHWNFYDLACVILNSPFVHNLFLADHLGVPQMHSFQRLFRTLHAIRLIRIHFLLRFVVETIFIALSGIYNTLLLEFVIVTVFALLSIAFEGDTAFWESNAYEPYENYTEALYSYYMCITLEGVNEVAEEILNLDSPQFTTVVGLIFYIFGAIVTYSVGQLLAAVIATYLGNAMDRITRDKSFLGYNHQSTTLIGLQRPTIAVGKKARSRCSPLDEVHTLSQLTSDDLALPIILFRVLDQNLSEYASILHDIHLISEYIGRCDQNNSRHSLSNHHEAFMQQQRLQTMISIFSTILHYLTEQDELQSPLGDFLVDETHKVRNHRDDTHPVFLAIEEHMTKIENTLQTTSVDKEQNRRHLLIIDRLKAKFYEKNHAR